MSKKKLLEFGLKEADAFQKNFKIFLDRLIKGYKSVMNREPEGLDLLKIKMEAREKALNTTKVVNQKGLTLDPDKPIIGGTQEGIETIKTKFDLKETQDAMLRKEMKELDENMKFFQKEIDKAQGLDEFNLSKDDPMGDLEKIIKGEGKTGLPKEGVKPFKYRSPDEFTNRKEYEKYLEEVLGPADDVFGNPVKDQMLENFDKVKAKNVTPRPFGDNIRDAYREAGRSREDATEMIKALDSPGAKQSYEIMEEALGVRLYGDETFEELMQIKETGVHPRGEPPLKKADGGRIGFSQGGESIIGSDIGMIGGLMGAPTTEDDDEFSEIAGQTAGLGVLSGLTKVFGPKIGTAIFNRGRKKTLDTIADKAIDAAKKAEAERVAKEAARKAEISRIQQRLDRDPRGTGPGPSPGGPYGGGPGGLHSDYADGGLATMFVEKR